MPMYTPGSMMRAPRQQLAAEGKNAPQQGNAGGGNGQYSSMPLRQSGAATTRPVGGLSTALAGAQASPSAAQPPQPPQMHYRYPQPAQGQNRAFSAWGEPGGGAAPAPAPQGGPTLYEMGGGGNRAAPGAGIRRPGYPTSTVGDRAKQAMQFGQQQGGGGPPMMGPATGRMSLSGALSGGGQPTSRGFMEDLGQGFQNAFNSWSQSSQADSGGPQATSSGSVAQDRQNSQDSLTADERQAALNDGLDPNDPSVVAMLHGGQAGSAQQYRDPNSGGYNNGMSNSGNQQGFIGGGISSMNQGGNSMLGGMGYDAGRTASAFPSGFAAGLNESGLDTLNQYYNNFSDIQGLKNQGNALMDPAQQAAADAAERATMQAGINTQRDDALRMLMAQKGRGGAMGTGASTGILNSALRAQALGEQNLAQDQYQRMLGRTQLGGNMISDYGRQKYGIMNDQYVSPGEVAAMLLQGAQTGVDIANKMPGSQNPFLSFLTGGH